MHYWSVVISRWLREVEHQRPWMVNVWCVNIGGRLVDPFFIEGSSDWQKYQDFLHHLPELIDHMPVYGFNVSAALLIMPEFPGNLEYPAGWIGRGSPVA
nr:unnamed protein product [Callosobruchus analis]